MKSGPPRALPRLGASKPASAANPVLTSDAPVAGNVVPVRQTITVDGGITNA